MIVSPKPLLRSLALLSVATLGLTACGDDNDPAAGTSDAGHDAADTATDVADDGRDDAGGDVGEDAGLDALDGNDTATTEPDCDRDRRPIVLAHGFLASGDTWAPHAMRFAQNGHCLDAFRAFDWNTLDQVADHVADLDAFIDGLLAELGAEQVDLVGHSAGGRLGYDYLRNAERAAKVAHYAHVGSFVNPGPAGPGDAPVPTLNIWSPDDTVVADGGDIEGATNVSLAGADHYAVATNDDSFTAMYRFFTDGDEPESVTLEAEDTIVLHGRALSFGENQPTVGATVTIWALEGATGTRPADPAAVLITDDEGRWGPFAAQPTTRYEFHVSSATGDGVAVSYYREPFTRSNPLVYLRTLPGPGSIAGALVGALPFDHHGAVIVVFSSSRALLEGVDSLTLDGTEVLNEETAPASNTTIAMFFYDSDRDRASSLTPVALFASFPFLSALDLYIDGTTRAPVAIDLNGRVLHVAARPGEDGAAIALFD